MYVDFDIVVNKIINEEVILNDSVLNDIVKNNKNLNEYLGSGLYLCFDMDEITNERNFENGCTSDIIKPDKLKVLVLHDKINNNDLYSRFDVIHYMMNNTKISDIKYYGVKYENSPKFEDATKKIQDKVNKYYSKNIDIIKKYNIAQYDLIEIPLKNFIREYLKKWRK